jgi:transposase
MAAPFLLCCWIPPDSLLSHGSKFFAKHTVHPVNGYLAANQRLNIAYLLKESFGQLWNYQSEAWARRFFENWKQALKWQRLKPYEKFARMIDRHWDGIAAYCEPRNKVPLGFVKGFNNRIRVLHRRAYGLRDEEYLRLKILTCMLLEL